MAENNIFTNWMNNMGDWMASRLAPYINDALGQGYTVLGRYYGGDQRPQLKTAVGKQDDNIFQNWIGLAVDRSVSRLFRGGVKFVAPEGKDQQQEYLDKVWDLNKKEILLYQYGLHGTVYGTPYIKIRPDAMIDPYTDKPYPSLTALDPEIIRFRTSPQDMDEVLYYCIKYKIGETAYWEITYHTGIEIYFDSNNDVQYNYVENSGDITWIVDEWKQVGGGAKELIGHIEWLYSFPPIIHQKNLPSLKSQYGDSDIDDAINIQDKSNFVVSNTAKIVKFFAHPETVGTGFKVSDVTALDGAVGSFHIIPNENAKVFNLEMNSDLASSRNLSLDLRQSIFDISREVDVSSMSDKLGALTNFGLQILWSDAIDKNNTKRQLYGDALIELNRRLLVLANFAGKESNPGVVKWGNPLPVNISEEIQADKTALELGIIDKETVSLRYFDRYGKEWEDIKKAVDAEKEKENKDNSNIGASILKNFNKGKGF